MSLFKKLAAAFGFVHDKDKALEIEAKAKAATKAAAKLPENVRVNKLGHLERVSFEQDGAQWENITPKQVAKSNQLTDTDLQAISGAGLDVAKAAMIKPHWAQGSSQTETAAALGGGFSKRTLAKYWVVFNQETNAT